MGSIKYRIDLLEALKAAGWSTYRMRQEKALAESVLQQIRRGDIVTPEKLAIICNLLHCQPGELLEFTNDEGESPETIIDAPPAPQKATTDAQEPQKVDYAPAGPRIITAKAVQEATTAAERTGETLAEYISRAIATQATRDAASLKMGVNPAKKTEDTEESAGNT